MSEMKGTSVKAGDCFGEIGYWVTKNMNNLPITFYINHPEDKAGASPHSSEKAFYYWGTDQPIEQEMLEFLNRLEPRQESIKKL